jgi:hypothetical protein
LSWTGQSTYLPEIAWLLILAVHATMLLQYFYKHLGCMALEGCSWPSLAMHAGWLAVFD